MDLRAMAKFNLLILLPLLCLQATAEIGGSVSFFEAKGQRYIRGNPSETAGEVNSLLIDEVSAAISVLLGFAPPSLSAESSVKLNKVLVPNPFDRPHAVLVLEVGGLEHPFSSFDSKLGSTFTSGVLGSATAHIQLPDESEVSVFPFDDQLVAESDDSSADKELGDLAELLGGSYLGSLEASNGEMKLPLASGDYISLLMAKKSDRHFVQSLVSLVRSVNKAVALHEDISASTVNPAELMIGHFTGIEALRNEYGSGDIVDHAQELFQTALIRSFDLMQKSYNGKIVGVILSTSQKTTGSETMLDVKLSTRASRWLEEAASLDTTIPEMLLVRRSLAWITGIILLVSALLGIYYLLYMPITRDTLLYSNVKLD